MSHFTRRQFLTGAAASAGGLTLAMLFGCGSRSRTESRVNSLPVAQDSRPFLATFSVSVLGGQPLNPNGLAVNASGLWSYDHANANLNLVVPNVKFFDRNGERLVYVLEDGNSGSLLQRTIGFTGEKLLIADSVIYNPALSNFGTVAYETPTGIETVLDGGSEGIVKRVIAQVDNERQYFGKPRWDPSGNLVIQHIDQDKGIDTLEVIDLDTGAGEELPNTGDVNFFDVDPYGNIAYSSVETGRIMLLEKGYQPRSIHDLNEDSRGGAHVDFAERGKAVIFQTPGKIGKIDLVTGDVIEVQVNGYLHDIKAP